MPTQILPQRQSQDNDENSETYGIYSDWYFASGRDSKQQDHWEMTGAMII